MKRLHVHVSVEDLSHSLRFYSALFAAQPSVVKADYAKWMLEDPRVNFAISTRGRQAGLVPAAPHPIAPASTRLVSPPVEIGSQP